MDTQDRAIFEELNKFESKIDARLRRKGIPDADRPDLLQAVYERTIKYLKSNKARNLGGLLLTIADRVAADYWDEREIHERAAPQLIEEEASPYSLEEDLNDQQIRFHLNQILEGVSHQARALLIAYFTEGQKLEQIAARFGTSKSTAHDKIAKTVEELAAEFARRKITSRALLPFDEKTIEREPASDRGEADGPFARPVPPRPRPKSEPWKTPAIFVLGGALGALIVFLLLQHAQPLVNLEPIVLTVATPAGHGAAPSPVEPSTPELTLEQQRALLCPEPPPAPAAPAPRPSPPDPGTPKINARNRHLARIIEAAEERGDCETANKLRGELTGAFAAAFAERPPCKPTP